MGDKRFSNLAVLNGHKQRTDSVSIADIAQKLFPAMRTTRETSTLRTASKSSNLRRFIKRIGYIGYYDM